MWLSVNVWVISLVARWLSVSAHLHGTPLGVGDIPVVLPASIAKRVRHKCHVHYPLKIVSSLPPPMELFQNVLGGAWKLESCIQAVFMPKCPELNLKKSKAPIDYHSKCLVFTENALSWASFFFFFSEKKTGEFERWLSEGKFAVQACIWVPASLQHPRKKPDVDPRFCNSSAVRGRGRKALGLLGHWPSSEFSGRPCMAGIRHYVIEQVIRHPPLSLGSWDGCSKFCI